MKQLEEMTYGQRVLLTLLIVLVILFALAFLGWATGRWEDGPQADAAPSKQIALCSDEPGINDRINQIAFEALDNALRDQIARLFSTWMKDNTGQPERAATGVKQSAVAYVHAREAILNWNIPPCQ